MGAAAVIFSVRHLLLFGLLALLGSHAAAAAAFLDESDLVESLPGQPIVKFKHYAGQLLVDDHHGRALFYWFFEADHPKASRLPLALWLNGGPGCSSVGNGGLSELGPFTTNDNATGLNINPYSWTKAANIIFLESPAGVGFSYSDTEKDLQEFRDYNIARDSLVFLDRWLDKFPQYRKNEFYLVGESYAGHYIPTLARLILDHNALPHSSRINLKGFAIGNPWTDALYDNRGTTDYFFSHTLISEETYRGLLQCDFANDLPIDARSNNARCSQALDQADVDMEKINMYDIYAESCNPLSSRSNTTANKKNHRAYQLTAAYVDPCLDSVTPYLNLDTVQAALHVKRKTKWSGCSDFVYSRYRRGDITASMLPIYRQLLRSKLRIWIYSGDADAVVATTATKLWLRQLNLTIDVPFYAWNYQNQVGGWTETYKEGLTFATVRGAGHMVPATRPGQALCLFKNFLQGKPLPGFS